MSAHHLADLGVIIVAAGRGERLGHARPKAFVEVAGKTLLEHSARTVTSLPHNGQLVLVVPAGWAGEALGIADLIGSARWQISVVTGGRDRHESVRMGLDALGATIQTVLVHDAARPLTPAEVFEQVIAAVHEHNCGIVPAVPLFDTLKIVDEAGNIQSTADRQHTVAAQTPQGFPREMLSAAHQSAQLQGGSAASAPSDDAEVVQRAGGTVRIVAGSPFAHKLTTPSDATVLKGLLGVDAA